LLQNNGALNDIGQMCSDYNTKLFWTSLSKGTENGLIFSTNLDSDIKKAVKLNNDTESSNGIAYYIGYLFYLTNKNSLAVMGVEH
jgi:hypothetical protein